MFVILLQTLIEQLNFNQGKLGMKVAFDFVNDDKVRFGVYLHAGARNFIELFKGEPGDAAGNLLVQSSMPGKLIIWSKQWQKYVLKELPLLILF